MSTSERTDPEPPVFSARLIASAQLFGADPAAYAEHLGAATAPPFTAAQRDVITSNLGSPPASSDAA